MSPSQQAGPDAALDRFVHALVMWGATASQIVAHMEHTKRSGASTSQASTVDAFAAHVGELAGPVVAGRGIPLARAAEAVEAIDAEVRAQTLLVPLAPRRPARSRRPR